MANLTNQVLVYSVSTDAFFNNEENQIGSKLMDLRIKKNELLSSEENTGEVDDLLKDVNESINTLSKELNVLLDNNKDIRTLRRDHLYTYNKEQKKEVNKSNKVVALFESSFTRLLGLSTKDVNESVVIVKAYHYKALENLINKGFYYGDDNEEFVFWSSSAGQMKNKKCVFVKKTILDQKRVNDQGVEYTAKDSLIAGLDWGRINNTKFNKGEDVEYGININKYLAYLSLQNTATVKWDDFDINQVIVVPDLEIDVTDTVEFIDRDTYQIHPPEEKTLPMNVSDGVGLILPTLADKNFQFRIPFGKGLLSPYDFLAHAKKVGNYEVVDVWGETHHLVNDNVKIILSASQLKTWKYYNSMEEYRELFRKYECEAGKCNEEVVTKDIHLNYQYIQSLDMEFDELEKIAEKTNDDIKQLGNKKNVMLRSLGATEENEKKNNFQQALLMYDNLLNDSHAKEMIKSKKSSMVKDAKSGTLRADGKRMFILPDLYAYCEFLLTGNKNPEGLLNKGEVYTKKIKAGTVDILRSPQLYREHGIQKNTRGSDLSKWFNTGAIYINNKNFLARLLQCDFDGDQVNVVNPNTKFVEVAKRNMEADKIVPLYYEMSTAPLQTLSEKSIYTSLISSFGSAIGSISNDVTKVWNSGKLDKDKQDAIKFLTMYNNFMIDFSKTNFLPKPKGDAKRLIRQYTKAKSPYFFQWAKDKEVFEDKVVAETEKDVDENGKEYDKVISEYMPVMNMLEDIIVDKRITFKSVADTFDYTKLMSVVNFKSEGKDLDKAIVSAYKKINRRKKSMIDQNSETDKENKYVYAARAMKDEIMDAAREIEEDVSDVYVADCLIYHFHVTNKNGNKKTMWEAFGDIIVTNLNYKLNGIKICQYCSDGFKAKSHKNKYCSDACSKEGEKIIKKVKRKKAKNN
ncbi:arsenate reductase-like glutaredoxin family protein [Virgibacillus natechei]|uniref:Arsenate reductase-like glutaredoxin family protein n=1 Tax=Virgibacillus natechei TaxID=1216297 RepID=A0ABS4IAN7_9BACI|nr:hypothetical protein [Virgibacillus natechei]MBP1967998.1 arsenate reductase-like glutaredoxin family protein [Virgibacillus natechei]UZD14719.1 hypothetical protein OLD84_09550 [Virgibacillus natechei]